jgi:hypothetical protein
MNNRAQKVAKDLANEVANRSERDLLSRLLTGSLPFQIQDFGITKKKEKGLRVVRLLECRLHQLTTHTLRPSMDYDCGWSVGYGDRGQKEKRTGGEWGKDSVVLDKGKLSI